MYLDLLRIYSFMTRKGQPAIPIQKPGKSGKSSDRKAGGDRKPQSRSAKAGLLFPECAMTEAFPNAESAFRDAFNQPDPVPKLLELITAHPDVQAIADLILVYTKLVGEFPTQFDKFRSSTRQSSPTLP